VGDLGLSRDLARKLVRYRMTGDPNFGGGYQFNEWLRADVTVDRSVFRKSGTIGQVWCPYQMVGLTDQVTGHTVGIFANSNDTCSRIATASLVRTSVMANAYFDIYTQFTSEPENPSDR